MSLKLIQYAPVAGFVLLLASCVPKWDAAQQAALATVAVPAPAITQGAYHQPIGKMPTGPTPVVVVQGGDFASGAAGNAIAQLIVEGVGMAQQSMYDKNNSDAIARVPSTLPGDLSQRVRKAVVRELESHVFFKRKLRDTSPNRLIVTIHSFGYVRTSKVEGKILMTPQMFASFELLDAGGKSLLSQPLLGYAANHARPLEDFAGNRQLASNAFDATIASIALQLAAAIDLKAGVPAT